MSNTPPLPTPQSITAIDADTDPKPAPADDWTGTTDPAERRRRQNRINQRAHRRRQRLSASKNIHPKSVVLSPSTTVRSTESVSSDEPSRNNSCPSYHLAKTLLSRFAQSAYESYMRGDPTSDHLLTLTKVNVFRAFGQNMTLIGLSLDSLDDDAISPFNIGTASGESPVDDDTIPVNLRPTKLQKTIPHHPWLDFFPLPKMRDNLIQAGDEWDDEELCHDIMGFWNTASKGEAGLLVWGDPWDIRNWEVTEPFLKKWQWVVRGCPQLMDATNAWRTKRGEKLIFRYI